MSPPLCLNVDRESVVHFTEVTRFPAEPGWDVSNPKGIAFDPYSRTLITTIVPFRDKFHGALLSGLIGRLRTFPFRVFGSQPAQPGVGQRLMLPTLSDPRKAVEVSTARGDESKFAVVPLSGPPVSTAHFSPGDIFIGRGMGQGLIRLTRDPASPNQLLIDEAWALKGYQDERNSGFWGGIAFDVAGHFGGRLIILDLKGFVGMVDADGTVTAVGTVLADHPEALAVAPTSFAASGGAIFAGLEGNAGSMHRGEIYAIDQPGGPSVLLGSLPTQPGVNGKTDPCGPFLEQLLFVPPMGGTLFQAEANFFNSFEADLQAGRLDVAETNRILCAPASCFINRRGMVLAVNELTGQLFQWDGSFVNGRPAMQLVAQAPEPWSTFTVKGSDDPQNSELEQSCFAVVEPRLPCRWSPWLPVQSAHRPQGAMAACGLLFNDPGNPRMLIPIVALFSRAGNGDIVLQQLRAVEETWQPNPATLANVKSVTPPAAAARGTHTWVFTVDDKGRVVVTELQLQRPAGNGFCAFNQLGSQVLSDIEGGGLLTTSLAVGATLWRSVFGEMVAVAAINAGDGQVYVNVLGPNGGWGKWKQAGGSPANLTRSAPVLGELQGELYILVRQSQTGRLLLRGVFPDFSAFSEWGDVSFGLNADESLCAARDASEDQLYLFASQAGAAVSSNGASLTGTWGGKGWITGPNRPAAGAMQLTSIVTAGKLFLFATGDPSVTAYWATSLQEDLGIECHDEGGSVPRIPRHDSFQRVLRGHADGPLIVIGPPGGGGPGPPPGPLPRVAASTVIVVNPATEARSVPIVTPSAPAGSRR